MPPSGRFEVGDTFQATIVVNTQSHETDRADIFLNYPNNIVEVIDEDASISGVQIEARNLYPNTLINEVSVDQGKIVLSQAIFGEQKFQGGGILAVINFKALAPGVVPLTFDFERGKESNTSIVAGEEDVLYSAAGASFTVVGADKPPADEDQPPADEPPNDENPLIDNEDEPDSTLDIFTSKAALYALILLLIFLVVILVILRK